MRAGVLPIILLLGWLGGCDRTVGLPDLVGPDDNGNGIRDSVDSYFVDELWVLPDPVMLAAHDLARAYEAVLRVDLGDRSAVHRTGERVSLATACLYSAAKDSQSPIAPGFLSKALENRTYNSTVRVERVRQFSKLLDGTAWKHPGDRGCLALSEVETAE